MVIVLILLLLLVAFLFIILFLYKKKLQVIRDQFNETAIAVEKIKNESLMASQNIASKYDSTIVFLKEELSKEKSRNKSVEVKTGQIMEKLVPFLEIFKYKPEDAHFLGMPVDLVVFSDDEVVILEVKTGDSKLTPKQSKIKKNIENGRVRFELLRIKGDDTNNKDP